LTPPLDQRTINSDHLSDSVIMAIPARWYLLASPGAGFFFAPRIMRQASRSCRQQRQAGKASQRSMRQHYLTPLDLIVAETSSDLAMWTNDGRLAGDRNP
jgi:hypothetical protein